MKRIALLLILAAASAVLLLPIFDPADEDPTSPRISAILVIGWGAGDKQRSTPGSSVGLVPCIRCGTMACLIDEWTAQEMVEDGPTKTGFALCLACGHQEEYSNDIVSFETNSWRPDFAAHLSRCPRILDPDSGRAAIRSVIGDGKVVGGRFFVRLGEAGEASRMELLPDP